jgi:hypothetical protein
VTSSPSLDCRPLGTTRPSSVSNKYRLELDGRPLRGKLILEVPDSNLSAANRAAFEELARGEGIEIRYSPE